MSTIVGTNIEVTNLKYDSDTTSMIISNTGQVTIQSEGTAQTSIQQGLAKCWHLMDHAGGSSLDSFNVTSFTDQATGHYRTNIANDMASANYVTTGSNIQGDTEYFSCMISDGGLNGAGSCDYKIVRVDGVIVDNDILNVAILGDLA